LLTAFREQRSRRACPELVEEPCGCSLQLSLFFFSPDQWVAQLAPRAAFVRFAGFWDMCALVFIE
jgi:hypothetical protein